MEPKMITDQTISQYAEMFFCCDTFIRELLTDHPEAGTKNLKQFHFEHWHSRTMANLLELEINRDIIRELKEISNV